MATKNWKTSADGIWNVGANWTDGSAPAAGDDVSLAGLGGHVATLVQGAYGVNSLSLTAGGTLSMNGLTLSAGTVALSNGTLRGGSLTVGTLNASGFSGNATLDAMRVTGQINIGSSAQSRYLTIRNGLSMSGSLNLSDGSLMVDGNQSITGAAITVANNGSSQITSPGASTSQVLLTGGSMEIAGKLTALAISLNEGVHVSSSGYLAMAGTPTVNVNFGANARIAVDAGGQVVLSQNLTSDALTEFANKVSPAAGAFVALSGTIDNTGRTLDLSSASAVGSRVSTVGDTIVGGTVVNSGAAAASLNNAGLYGVSLRGQFRADNGYINKLTVRDSLSVLNTDGSAGTLDLANVGSTLVVDTIGGSNAGTFTLANMTLRAAGISANTATLLDTSFKGDFAVSGGIRGTVVNHGTVIAESDVFLDLGYASGGGTAASAGRFDNDGTVAVFAGGHLNAGAGFVNNGIVRLGNGATALFGSTSVGALSVEGSNVSLTFAAKGVTGSLAGLNSDDRLLLQTGGAGSAAATVSGRTLTLVEDGSAVGSFDLGQDGWSSGDFAASIDAGGIVTVTNTHGAAAPVQPVNPVTPVNPVAPVTPVAPAGDDGKSPITVVAGATLTTGTAGRTVSVATAGTVVSNGPDRISGGSGATVVRTSGSGATVVGGAGALTASGGSGSNTIFAGTGGLTYQGGRGFDTVIGLGKPLTATGGSGGGQFFGGGNATITAGAGGDLNVVIGGNGDRLYAAGPSGVLFGTSGGDVLMSSAADTGTSVFFGANGTGRMSFITGAGTDLLALGQGTNDVTLGSGHAVIFANGGASSHTTITAGSGSLDLAFSGADTVLNIAAAGARSFNLYGLGSGSNHIHLQGFGGSQVADVIAGQRNIGGGTQLSLTDGSVISLVGVGRATTSLFS